MQCTDALPEFIISSEQVIIQEDPDISRPRIRSLSDLPLFFKIIFAFCWRLARVGVRSMWQEKRRADNATQKISLLLR